MYADIFKQLLIGFGYTLLLFGITLLFAIPLGLLVCFCSMSKFKPLKYISKFFVLIIRGTPLMLQIILISFIPSMVFKITNIDIAKTLNISISNLLFIFVAIAFIINYAAYFSEIFRAGIESIDKGQYEAGIVVGMSKRQIFDKIRVIQVIKRILPPMSNEIITLVKDTSLAKVLGVVELLSAANSIVNQYVILTPLLYAGAFYLLFSLLLTFIFDKIETRLKVYEG